MAVALSLVVHNAARVSMLDNSRDLANERIQVAQRMYESGRPLKSGAFGVKLDDPDTCPSCGKTGTFTEARQFNLMFKTYAGPVEGSGAEVYLRPRSVSDAPTMQWKVDSRSAQPPEEPHAVTPDPAIWR